MSDVPAGLGPPPWRIGVDVGGTFTDLVLADAAGGLWATKVPSTPSDPSAGVLDAVAAAAAAHGMTSADLLGGTALFLHGSTVATNTLLEGKGAKVGLLTTRGFRDSLEIRRGRREDQWDHRTPYAPVLVPRSRRLPVTERIDRHGAVAAPVEVDDVTAAADLFRDEGVESVAIAFLNSFLNPSNERDAAAALRQRWDCRWVSTSGDLVPLLGEYERTSTVVVNAVLAPRVVAYLRALDERLRELGLRRPLLLIQSNGGAVSVGQLAERPVNLVLSGPAAGVGALNYYRRAAGTDELISMEIGGTSCDVMLMAGGQVANHDHLLIAGYHVAIPSIEIHTIGAGGGTIAGVDRAGLLFVGPQGAGANPGPAAYGKGGTRPTVTDAQLVLGRLRPGPYAGGAVSLDRDASIEALRREVGEPLGLDAEAAAIGVIQLVELHLQHAVERISIERGQLPARFTFVAAGGAGPMHGATVGRALGCRRVYIPRQAGAFCAIGMLHADVRQDYLRMLLADLDTVGHETVEAAFATLESRADAALAEEGFAPADRVVERAADLRYPGQFSTVRVPVAAGALDRAALRAAFETDYDRLYGHIQPGGQIEVTSLRVAGRGLVAPLEPSRPTPASGAAVADHRRPVWLDPARGWVDTAVYVGSALAPGHRVDGPAIVEESTTTVLVGADDTLVVDEADNFVIELGGL